MSKSKILVERNIDNDINNDVDNEDDIDNNENAIRQKCIKKINEKLAANVQDKFMACQKFYLDSNSNGTCKTYEKVGHWTTSDMNLAVIRFFLAQMK